jgi:hypothetical protein
MTYTETSVEMSIARLRRLRRTLSVLAIAVGVFGLGTAGAAVWLATQQEDAPAAAAATSSDAATAYDDYGSGSDSGSQYDNFGGGTGYDEYEPMDGWTAIDEQALLNAIESQAMFDAYDPYCVVGVIQDTYDSLDEFGLAAGDPAEMRPLGYAVVSECGVAASY